jgi:16S rRNA (adenine1518-N6/adenine1519-N6)-dimethyltransferase
MTSVKPKKRLGQHFLKNEEIARQIAETLGNTPKKVLEIGPGTGILTKYLLQNQNIDLKVVEIDEESVAYLQVHFPQLQNKILATDFLKMDLTAVFNGTYSIIGNFPYNISSQILFRLLDNREQIPELIGMFQKEVAERVTSSPGKKQYGILSVLLQAFFDVEYLFTVHENEFYPPPKVKSAVIKLSRNPDKQLTVDETIFKQVVKTAFNQRRKTLKNSLKTLNIKAELLENPLFSKRPEQLSISEFETICV